MRSSLTAFSLIALTHSLSALSAQAEEASLSDIPYGVEALIQYRSEYSYRGFILTQDALDVQLSAQYTFNKTSYLNTAIWFTSSNGDSDFSEAGLLVDYRKEINQWTFSLASELRDYSDSFFESGLNLQASASYHLTDRRQINGRVAYDTGARGWYSSLDYSYYLPLDKDTYFHFSGGISAVSDYYTRSGLNDIFAKIAYTHNLNSSISITPYIGTSILLDSSDAGSDSLHGGVYFTVSF